MGVLCVCVYGGAGVYYGFRFTFQITTHFFLKLALTFYFSYMHVAKVL